MPDADLLAAIRADPDDGARWLALAEWLQDHGRADEAAAVRVFWGTLRDSLTEWTLESALEDVRRHATIFGRPGPRDRGAGGPSRTMIRCPCCERRLGHSLGECSCTDDACDACLSCPAHRRCHGGPPLFTPPACPSAENPAGRMAGR